MEVCWIFLEYWKCIDQNSFLITLCLELYLIYQDMRPL